MYHLTGPNGVLYFGTGMNDPRNFFSKYKFSG
jgi:hypothetical protein